MLAMSPAFALGVVLSAVPTSAPHPHLLLQHVAVSAWPVAAIMWVVAVSASLWSQSPVSAIPCLLPVAVLWRLLCAPQLAE